MVDMDDVKERLVRLEEKVSDIEKQHTIHKELLKDIDTKVTSLTEQFIKHKGFMGGVIFTLSTIWAIITVSIGYFFKR